MVHGEDKHLDTNTTDAKGRDHKKIKNGKGIRQSEEEAMKGENKFKINIKKRDGAFIKILRSALSYRLKFFFQYDETTSGRIITVGL